MTYLILSQPSETRAREFSRLLYRLSCPEHVRSPDDITEFFTGYVVHPVTGEVALEVPDTDMSIHADADGTALAVLIGAVVPRVEHTKLRSDVRSKRGRPATMIELLPDAPAAQAGEGGAAPTPAL